MASFELDDLLRDGDALIIVPPFAGLDRPSLGVHLLQACAREAGFNVSVFYANIALAAEIGEAHYQAICYAPTGALLGERFFAATAYNVPPFGRRNDNFNKLYFQKETGKLTDRLSIDLEALQQLEPGMGKWADDLVAAILDHRFKVVGCTSTFEQTAASVALLNRIKQADPQVTTIIGGANCEGEMAEGIMSLGAQIDFVFSGESESSFPEFLKRVLSGQKPSGRIIEGEPCMNLDAIPAPDFTEFYEQFAKLLPESVLAEQNLLWLPYESSRGCWWGEKHHCTFCGLNAQTMKHREKSPSRVIDDLKRLLEKHPNKRVCMVDNIMPHRYFRTLLPQLSDELPGLHLFYEEKANLNLEHVLTLQRGGVQEIQPGIEALSSSLLKRMDKGVTAQQNIALMRYALAAGLGLNWNLLYAFPGDHMEDYEQTLALVPLIRHLQPPGGLGHLSIDRFSPYFDYPERYGVTNVRPMESYAAVLPSNADVPKVAYHFVGDYATAVREHPDIAGRIDDEIRNWRAAWESEEEALPALVVTHLFDDTFLLLDTRGLEGTEQIQFLSREQASVVLAGRRLEDRDEAEWALDARLVVELDSRFVPLATASPQLLSEFETERHKHERPPQKSLPVLQHVSGDVRQHPDA